MITALPNNQRETWDFFHAGTPESISHTNEANVMFRKLFPEGHQASIRSWIEEEFAKLDAGEEVAHVFRDLKSIHPRARSLLLKHGKDYRPSSFLKDSPHLDEEQPKERKCFQNAAVLMGYANQKRPANMRPITYVEGVVAGATSRAIFHAWNGFGFAGKGADWSYYAESHWNRYFGVPFTQTEYFYIIDNAKRNRGNMIMFFRHDCFEWVEKPLRKILERPRTRLCKRNGGWDWARYFPEDL